MKSKTAYHPEHSTLGAPSRVQRAMASGAKDLPRSASRKTTTNLSNFAVSF
jgi:hypothetical protein